MTGSPKPGAFGQISQLEGDDMPRDAIVIGETPAAKQSFPEADAERPELTQFYRDLGPVAELARVVADRIRQLGQRQNEAILDIGHELIAMKGQLGHRNFLGWVHFEFTMSVATAERYMQVARTFGDIRHGVTNMPVTALYLLAARSTPETIREEVIASAASGGKVSAAAIRRRLGKVRAPAPPPAPRSGLRPSKNRRAPGAGRHEFIQRVSAELHRKPGDTAMDLLHLIADEPGIRDLSAFKRNELAHLALKALGMTPGELLGSVVELDDETVKPAVKRH